MTETKEIVFRQDTVARKQWFKGLSFSHPAKMSLGLQIYLIEHYTKPGGNYEFTDEMLKETDRVIDWCKCPKNERP